MRGSLTYQAILENEVEHKVLVTQAGVEILKFRIDGVEFSARLGSWHGDIYLCVLEPEWVGGYNWPVMIAYYRTVLPDKEAARFVAESCI